MPVFLNGLATAVPPHALPQDLVERNARRILGPRFVEFERLAGAFLNAGVERRYSVAPFEWFEAPKNWAERNALYLEGAVPLFCEAARGALASAGLEAAEIDAVVTVSSTGIAAPSLEARAHAAMGFRPDVRRRPVFGLGCGGGVAGLALARELALARPGARVLLVALELCTLAFRDDRLRKADVIATVLFGDGAAAAAVSTRRGRNGFPEVALGEGQEQLWPDTLSIMGWDVDPQGFGVVFDRAIPAFAEAEFRAAAEAALARADLSADRIDRFVCHPGGAKVVRALETAMGLRDGALAAERAVLRDYGNMSAPTALFVLDRVLKEGAAGRMALCALGPGFTLSLMPLSVAHG
jgi:alkylresorcinol/alkylpyrone synthase